MKTTLLPLAVLCFALGCCSDKKQPVAPSVYLAGAWEWQDEVSTVTAPDGSKSVVTSPRTGSTIQMEFDGMTFYIQGRILKYNSDYYKGHLTLKDYRQKGMNTEFIVTNPTSTTTEWHSIYQDGGYTIDLVYHLINLR